MHLILGTASICVFQYLLIDVLKYLPQSRFYICLFKKFLMLSPSLYEPYGLRLKCIACKPVLKETLFYTQKGFYHLDDAANSYSILTMSNAKL